MLSGHPALVGHGLPALAQAAAALLAVAVGVHPLARRADRVDPLDLLVGASWKARGDPAGDGGSVCGGLLDGCGLRRRSSRRSQWRRVYPVRPDGRRQRLHRIQGRLKEDGAIPSYSYNVRWRGVYHGVVKCDESESDRPDQIALVVNREIGCNRAPHEGPCLCSGKPGAQR